MADATDVILHLADKQWSSAQQPETRLASLTGPLLIAAAVLQGFVALRGFDPVALIPAAAIAGLGVTGMVASTRLRNAARTELRRLRDLARRLDELHPDAGLGPDDDAGPLEPPAAFTLTRRLHLGVAVAGLADAVLVFLVGL